MAVEAMSVDWRAYVDAQDKAVTDITNARLDGIDRAIKVALDANEMAITKAELAADKRFASVNEFRQTLTDQTATFATKPSVDALHAAFEARLEAQRQAHDAEIKSIWKVVWALSGALAAIQAFLQVIPAN